MPSPSCPSRASSAHSPSYSVDNTFNPPSKNFPTPTPPVSPPSIDSEWIRDPPTPSRSLSPYASLIRRQSRRGRLQSTPTSSQSFQNMFRQSIRQVLIPPRRVSRAYLRQLYRERMHDASIDLRLTEVSSPPRLRMYVTNDAREVYNRPIPQESLPRSTRPIIPRLLAVARHYRHIPELISREATDDTADSLTLEATNEVADSDTPPSPTIATAVTTRPSPTHRGENPSDPSTALSRQYVAPVNSKTAPGCTDSV